MDDRLPPPGVDQLVAAVRASTASDFYAVRWGSADRFSSLPMISRADIIATPLSARRYKNERGLVKIVPEQAGPFLSEWSFADIGREPWGLVSARPMVYMSNPHEALEKSMWCYERNRVPLIGEENTAVAISSASAYDVDSLIADGDSLPKLLPYLQRRTKKLSSISIIGSSFVPSALMPFLQYAEAVRLLLALPEAGAIAEAALSEQPVFTLLPGCFAEEREGLLVLTKESLLVTPIIRYRTDIRIGLLKK